jgi:hypothetical protein
VYTLVFALTQRVRTIISCKLQHTHTHTGTTIEANQLHVAKSARESTEQVDERERERERERNGVLVLDVLVWR